METIRQKLANQNVWVRVVYAVILYISIFIATTIVSYFLLPEGMLKNKNPAQNWEMSRSVLTAALQIFAYNLGSVVLIAIVSLFAKKNKNEQRYISLGYLVMLILVVINGVVLGTWSFAIGSPPVPLLDRLLGIFDIFHRAALWEMIGQIFILSGLANIAIVRTNAKRTVARKMTEVKLTYAEKIVLISGLVLMLLGAVIEAIAIVAISQY